MSRIIWLVGASSGIGKSLIDELVKDAETLYISARSKDKLADLAQAYQNVYALPLDITDPAARATAISEITERSGRVDWLVLNAGTCEYVDVAAEHIDLGMYQRVMDTNFLGPVALTHEAMPLLHQSDDARLIGISSSVTFTPLPRAQSYGASKAAFTYWLGTMATDVKHQGNRVQVVSPGFVDTPLTQRNDFDMPFMISSENAARRIAHGIRHRQTHTHFPKRFTMLLQLERLLPLSWQYFLNSKLSRLKKS
ncbi:MAG: SDR family NAD(P)-dependent oxidoreductase [Natronospirillum sp.]